MPSISNPSSTVRLPSIVLIGLLYLNIGWDFSRAEDFSYQIRTALFSNRQFFWPSLTPHDNPIPSTLHLGVLPIHIQQYRESIPCDSCHRLSANGMEFYLENYWKDKLAGRFPNAQVELLAPHFKLVENQKLDLMALLDSLPFPWSKWFPDSTESLIYRPRDRMTNTKTRQALDRLGGLLNQDYLLITTGIDISIKPLISNGHTGGFNWKFDLIFWNVRESRVEWAMRYHGKAGFMDLDKSLDSHLDNAMGAMWDGLPRDLQALWTAEPR